MWGCWRCCWRTGCCAGARAARRAPCLPWGLPHGSHRGPDLPQLRKELELQRLGEIGNATGAAGAGLVADDALDGLQVMAAPQLEVVVEIHQSLGELVQVPARFRVVIHAEPGAGHLFAGAVGLAEIPRQVVLRRSEEHTSELQSQSNLVCRLLLEKKKKNETKLDAVDMKLSVQSGNIKGRERKSTLRRAGSWSADRGGGRRTGACVVLTFNDRRGV